MENRPVYFFIARYYGKFARMMRMGASVWVFFEDKDPDERAPRIELRVLNRWLRSGRAVQLTHKQYHLDSWQPGHVNAWVRQSRMSSTYFHHPPFTSTSMNLYVNTLAEFCHDARLLVMKQTDYQDIIGVGFERFEYVKLNPTVIPTRNELLHLAGFFRCGVTDLVRPANTRLQQTLKAMSISAPKGSLIARAVQSQTAARKAEVLMCDPRPLPTPNHILEDRAMQQCNPSASYPDGCTGQSPDNGAPCGCTPNESTPDHPEGAKRKTASGSARTPYNLPTLESHTIPSLHNYTLTSLNPFNKS